MSFDIKNVFKLLGYFFAIVLMVVFVLVGFNSDWSEATSYILIPSIIIGSFFVSLFNKKYKWIFISILTAITFYLVFLLGWGSVKFTF